MSITQKENQHAQGFPSSMFDTDHQIMALFVLTQHSTVGWNTVAWLHIALIFCGLNYVHIDNEIIPPNNGKGTAVPVNTMKKYTDCAFTTADRENWRKTFTCVHSFTLNPTQSDVRFNWSYTVRRQHLTNWHQDSKIFIWNVHSKTCQKECHYCSLLQLWVATTIIIFSAHFKVTLIANNLVSMCEL